MAILRRISVLYLGGEFQITPRKNRYSFILENGDTGLAKITKNMKFKLYSGGKLIAKANFICDQLINYNGAGQPDDEYLSFKEAGLTRRSIYKAIKRNGAEARAGILNELNNFEKPDSNNKHLGNIRESDYALWSFKVRLSPNENDIFQENFGSTIYVDFINSSLRNDVWDVGGGTYTCD